MNTHSITIFDGARITYDVEGDGPPLLLIHGLSQYRQLWDRYGWREALTPYFTVITPDLRGAGDSRAPASPAAHTLDRYISDFNAVLDDLGLLEANIWGWSFGGGLALQLAARSPRVLKAIASGTRFGRHITAEMVWARLADMARIEYAQATGDWTGITEQQRETARVTDPAVARARFCAAADWPPVQPKDIQRPTLLLTGTEDSPVVLLQERRAEIEALGLGLHVFPHLNHGQLVSERKTVLPLVMQFLTGIEAA